MDVSVDVDIGAPPSVVWDVVSDPRRWPEWTASMNAVELLDDRLDLGARARVSQPGMPPTVWTVTTYDHGSGFTRTARVGGVTTVASHEVTPLPAGRGSRLVLRLTQHGALAPLARLIFGGRTRRYVRQEAEGLKAAAEGQAGMPATGR